MNNSEPVNLTLPIYVNELALTENKDADIIKHEILSENIMIIRITPYASSDIEGVKEIIEELCRSSSKYGGTLLA